MNMEEMRMGKCYTCGYLNPDERDLRCRFCGNCLDPIRGHCHVGDKEECVPGIEDCEEHARLCTNDCHDECACQDFEG